MTPGAKEAVKWKCVLWHITASYGVSKNEGEMKEVRMKKYVDTNKNDSPMFNFNSPTDR